MPPRFIERYLFQVEFKYSCTGLTMKKFTEYLTSREDHKKDEKDDNKDWEFQPRIRKVEPLKQERREMLQMVKEGGLEQLKGHLKVIYRISPK